MTDDENAPGHCVARHLLDGPWILLGADIEGEIAEAVLDST